MKISPELFRVEIQKRDIEFETFPSSDFDDNKDRKFSESIALGKVSDDTQLDWRTWEVNVVLPHSSESRILCELP